MKRLTVSVAVLVVAVLSVWGQDQSAAASESCQTRKAVDGKGTETVDGITWQYELVDGVAVVGSRAGIGSPAVKDKSVGGDVKIPATLGGCTVRSIGPLAFANCSNMRTVDIPSTVTNIGHWAFYGCVRLKSLVIPPHVTRFGDGKGVFPGCSALRSLSIPAGVTDLHATSMDFPALERIDVDARNPVLKVRNGILWNMKTGIPVLRVKSFCGELNIPEGTTKIGRWQFAEWHGLTSVVLPEGVTEIEEAAFNRCRALKRVALPSSLQKIGDRAFEFCTELEAVELPAGLSHLGGSVFYGCEKLTSVTLPDGVREVPYRAFMKCSSLTNVIMSEKVSVIGEEAFEDCRSLSSLQLPHALRTISRLSFSGAGLKSLLIPDGVKSIGELAFYECNKLDAVNIPSSVTDLGKGVFKSCNKLSRLSILATSLYDVNPDAFAGINPKKIDLEMEDARYFVQDGMLIDRQLKSIVLVQERLPPDIRIPECVTNICRYAFASQTGIQSLVLPTGLNDFDFPSRSCAMTNVVVAAGNPVYRVEDGLVIDRCRREVVKCLSTRCGRVDVPDGITSIGPYAFCECNGVTEVNLPSTVTNIGTHAFAFTRVVSMNLPSSIRKIDSYAFWCCYLLEKLVVSPEDGERVLGIMKWGNPKLERKGDELIVVHSSRSERRVNTGRRFHRDDEEWCPGLAKVSDPKLGIVWAYSLLGDYSVLEGVSLPKLFRGCLEVPSSFEGRPVKVIEGIGLRSKGMTSIRLPETVEVIRSDAFLFSDNKDFGSINIPAGVCDESVFDAIDVLRPRSVDVSASNQYFTSKGGVVFDKELSHVVYCSPTVEEIELPASVTNISKVLRRSPYEWLMEFRVHPDNPRYSSCGGVLYDKDLTTVVRCPMKKESMVVPSTVTSIGRCAFYDCANLRSIELPRSVRMLTGDEFAGCTNLSEISVQSGHPDYTSVGGVLYNKDKTTVLLCPRGVRSYEFPNTARSVGAGAFQCCRQLKTLVVPSTVTNIDSCAFYGCKGLTSVTLPEGLNQLKDSVFEDCKNLVSVNLPHSICTIGRKAFLGCTSLEEVAMPPNLKKVDISSFAKTKFWECLSKGPIVFSGVLYGLAGDCPEIVVVPSNVVAIAEDAFGGRRALKKVVIPTSVTNIGERAFAGCHCLESVELASFKVGVGSHAFHQCSRLKEVVTPESNDAQIHQAVKSDGLETERVGNVLKIVRPSSLKEASGNGKRSWRDPQTGIEWRFRIHDGKALLGSAASADRALVDVSYTGDLIIPERLDGCPVEDVYPLAFAGCTNLTSIHVPRTVGQFVVEHSTLVSLTNVTFSAGTTWYSVLSKGRFLMSSLDSKMILDVCAGGTRRIDIPDGAEGLSYRCLNGASWLEEVHIPSTVKKIEANAFAGCKGLVRRYDPDGKGYMVIDGWLIPTDSVRGRKFIVPAGVRHIASVRSGVSPWPDVYEVELTEGLETIGDEVFSGANVETIEFPKSLRRCEGFSEPKDPWGMPLKRMPLRKWRGSLGRSSDMKRFLRNVIFNSSDVSFSLPDSVRRVTFAAGVTDIGVISEGRSGSGLSGGKGVKTVVLPSGLLSIRSLPDFPELTEITIPSSVTNIGKTVFQGCEKLKSVGVEKNGSVELVPIDEFRRKWNLLFPDGCLHLTDAKTGIRWIVRDGAPYKKGSVCTLVGIEDGQDPSVLTIPETIAGMSVVRVDWDYFLQSKSRSWRTEATSDAPPARTNVLSAVELRIPRTLEYVDLSAVARIFPKLQSLGVEEGGDKYSSSDGVLCKSGTAVCCPRNRKGRVVLGEGIWRIDRAFSNCTNLTEVVLPASIREIDSGAFSGCSRLEKLHLPEGLFELSGGAFDGCVKLFEKAKRYDGFYVLDGWAINPRDVGEAELGDHDETLILPGGLRGIADGAFSGCTNLLSVTFPKSLTYIGDSAFAHANIRTLELPEGVRSVGYRAFWGCTNLMSVSIPSSIGEWDSAFFYDGSHSSTFAGCTRLTSVHLAEGLRVLPLHGFSGCSGLESVAIPSSVTNDIERLGSTAPSGWFSSCPSLREVCVSPEHPWYKSIDGIVYAKGGKSLLCCPDGKRSVAIPDGVEIIGDYAFDKCSAIETIELPMSVTNIGKHAFYGCSGLKSVTIPEGVKQIGDCAFGNCRRLTEIRMPSTVREIGLLALEGDSVPERILTAPGDAERILGLVLTNGHSKLARMRSFQARYGRQSKDVGDRQESRFVVEGDALVRTISGFARWRDPETGIAWIYSVQGDDAVDVRTEFLEGYKGHLEVPAQLGGKRVSGLLGLYGGGDVTSLSLPMSVTNVNAKVLESCTKLKSVKMNVDGELKTIEMEDLRKQWNLSGSKNPAVSPAKGNLRQGGLLRARHLQGQRQESAAKVQADAEKAQREAEQAEQREQLLAIQEELRRVLEAKAAAEEKQKGK